MGEPIVIRAWSGPRNLSTALMRSWENRSDTAVLDEPLYAHYLEQTGLDHPAAAETIAGGLPDLPAAIALCQNPPLQTGETISYQKHMAHHLLPEMDLRWISTARNVLLVRHPRRVIASYARVRSEPTLLDLGFPQLLDLQTLLGSVPVVDADRFLANPEDQLRALCSDLDVQFDPAMLSWPPGSRPTDGPWAPHWYGSVEASTHFAPPSNDDPNGIDLPKHLEAVAAEAAEIYQVLVEA